MTFLPIPKYEDLDAAAKAASDLQLATHGEGLTTLNATLLGNVPSYETYMGLYTLREEIAPWIGERAVTLFSFAIADESDCPVCSLFFRKILVDSGDDPDNPEVTETEQLLMDWGRLIVRSPHDIPEDFYARLETAFGPERRLTLLAYAGQVVATTILATVGRIALDEALYDYRTPAHD
jgi:hypothetical protein